MTIELAPNERSTIRSALIQAGVPTRGMNDAALSSAYEQNIGSGTTSQPEPEKAVQVGKSLFDESKPDGVTDLGAKSAWLNERGIKTGLMTIAEKFDEEQAADDADLYGVDEPKAEEAEPEPKAKKARNQARQQGKTVLAAAEQAALEAQSAPEVFRAHDQAKPTMSGNKELLAQLAEALTTPTQAPSMTEEEQKEFIRGEVQRQLSNMLKAMALSA